MAIPKKPKLLYQITIRRKPYFRRFIWGFLAAITAFGALVALNTAIERQVADLTLLVVGVVVAGIVGAIFIARSIFSLLRWIRSRDETLRLFDQGFYWASQGQEAKYSWSTLKAYREGGHGVYIGGRPLMQWGAHTLTMQDDRVFKITSKHGNLRQLANLMRRPTAHVMGIKIGKALRDEEPVKFHPQLTMWPGGVQVGKQEIPWSEFDVRLKGSKMIVYQKTQNNKFRRVRQFDMHKVDNVGGFMEVATVTIRNHQRERFGV
jgi:hypothetical protein